MSRTKCWRDMRATVFGSEEDRQNDPEAEDVMLNALKTGVVVRRRGRCFFLLLSGTYRALQNLKVIVFSCKGYNTDIARDILDWWPRREELEGLYREHQKAEEQNKETSKKVRKASEPFLKVSNGSFISQVVVH